MINTQYYSVNVSLLKAQYSLSTLSLIVHTFMFNHKYIIYKKN